MQHTLVSHLRLSHPLIAVAQRWRPAMLSTHPLCASTVHIRRPAHRPLCNPILRPCNPISLNFSGVLRLAQNLPAKSLQTWQQCWHVSCCSKQHVCMSLTEGLSTYMQKHSRHINMRLSESIRRHLALLAGYLSLRIEHPHEAGWSMMQVRSKRNSITVLISLNMCTTTLPASPRNTFALSQFSVGGAAAALLRHAGLIQIPGACFAAVRRCMCGKVVAGVLCGVEARRVLCPGRQGTFIRNERAQDLDTMQRHESLATLGERVRRPALPYPRQV